MKAVVVTGSSKGVGLGLAQEFLKRGCSVTISSRGKGKVEEEVKKLGEEFGSEKVMGKVCDVADSGQVQELWNAAKQRFGRVDIWINNAGIANTAKRVWTVSVLGAGGS